MMGLDYSTAPHIPGSMYFFLYGVHQLFCVIAVVVLVYHPIICVGGVYMTRSVPHPVISVEYQLIGSMLVVLVLYR